MGLLSNMENRGKLIEFLVLYKTKISILSFLIGVMWLFMLAHHELSPKTYISENQLLPGLVNTHFSNTYFAGVVYNELKQECTDSAIKEKLLSYLKEIGLDVYSQRFQVISKKVSGTNIFGIYRSPRASGVESIILNVPFHGNCSSNGGISMMLALAKYFSQQTFWAKDIVFLVTDHQQFGLKAWLNAYYFENDPDFINEDLNGRAGLLQVAVTIDLHSDHFTHFDLLVDGLNGQLPNLDVFNVVVRIAQYESIPLKLSHQLRFASTSNYAVNLQTLLSMMVVQSTGYPSGNHGMFFKYRVEAVTLRSVYNRKISDVRYHIGFESLGRFIEGVFRSFNNMLERFHHSYFLYILPNAYHYISIGLYMPAFGCLMLPLVITLLVTWIKLFKLDIPEENRDISEVRVNASVLSQIFMTYLMSASTYYISLWLFSEAFQFKLEVLFILSSLIVFLHLFFCRVVCRGNEVDFLIFYFLSTIQLAVAITVLSLLNFSAAYIIGIFYVILCLLPYYKTRVTKGLRLLYCILSCPPMMVYLMCVLHCALKGLTETVLYDALELWKLIIDYDITNSTLRVWTRNILFYLLLPLWFSFATLVT
ncbi:glycosylphosphatidylinositol anchor attachment 1 protein-like [Hydra vulgaris]|uniref:Glycosylphosphatidylinositol anchor attachment 1 protein-like n=1 Tax=Hydra vulgaris TaxID=6087 RepID=A0ABM4DNQ9_HYDVU